MAMQLRLRLAVVMFSGAVLGAPAAADAPIRLDAAELDRVTAGAIVAVAGAVAHASGDELAKTSTNLRTMANATGAAEVGVAIARADAVACCDTAATSAETAADTSGELSISFTRGIDVNSGPFSRSRSLSVAVGVNTPR